MRESRIVVSNNLSLPLEVVTQSIAILARKRAGKSYLARGIAEQLLSADQQVVILDPKGDWWGIRSSTDGKGPGFPVVVLGGEHGDLPLEITAAETVARLIVEERVSVLLDLSDFKKYEIARFLGGDVKQRREGLLELIYRLKAKEEFRTPVMLIADEADAIAPQKPQEGEERMLGAMNDIVRRGGQRGIGSLLITQRSSVINKDVLTQTQVMIALRTIAELDLGTIMGWVDAHGDVEQARILKASLPSLPTGDAWVLSPGWPTETGIFQRIHASPITTFDSGATPKPGEKRIRPRNLADVDMGALQRKMAETIERAKADDPRELRRPLAAKDKQIAELAKQRPAAPAKAADPELRKKDFERGAMSVKAALRAELKNYQRQMAEMNRVIVTNLLTCGHDAKKTSDRLNDAISQVEAAPLPIFPDLGEIIEQVKTQGIGDTEETRQTFSHKTFAIELGSSNVARPTPKASSPAPRPSGQRLPSGEAKVLGAIAMYEDGVSKTDLCILTGYKARTRNDYLQRLRNKGFTSESGETVCVTNEGMAALPEDFEGLPVGDELARYWLDRLPAGERKILEVLLQQKSWIERSSLDEATGYAPRTRNDYLSRLGARKIIVTEGSSVRVSETLRG